MGTRADDVSLLLLAQPAARGSAGVPIVVDPARHFLPDWVPQDRYAPTVLSSLLESLAQAIDSDLVPYYSPLLHPPSEYPAIWWIAYPERPRSVAVDGVPIRSASNWYDLALTDGACFYYDEEAGGIWISGVDRRITFALTFDGSDTIRLTDPVSADPERSVHLLRFWFGGAVSYRVPSDYLLWDGDALVGIFPTFGFGVLGVTGVTPPDQYTVTVDLNSDPSQMTFGIALTGPGWVSVRYDADLTLLAPSAMVSFAPSAPALPASGVRGALAAAFVSYWPASPQPTAGVPLDLHPSGSRSLFYPALNQSFIVQDGGHYWIPAGATRLVFWVMRERNTDPSDVQGTVQIRAVRFPSTGSVAISYPPATQTAPTVTVDGVVHTPVLRPHPLSRYTELLRLIGVPLVLWGATGFQAHQYLWHLSQDRPAPLPHVPVEYLFWDGQSELTLPNDALWADVDYPEFGSAQQYVRNLGGTLALPVYAEGVVYLPGEQRTVAPDDLTVHTDSTDRKVPVHYRWRNWVRTISNGRVTSIRPTRNLPRGRIYRVSVYRARVDSDADSMRKLRYAEMPPATGLGLRFQWRPEEVFYRLAGARTYQPYVYVLGRTLVSASAELRGEPEGSVSGRSLLFGSLLRILGGLIGQILWVYGSSVIRASASLLAASVVRSAGVTQLDAVLSYVLSQASAASTLCSSVHTLLSVARSASASSMGSTTIYVVTFVKEHRAELASVLQGWTAMQIQMARLTAAQALVQASSAVGSSPSRRVAPSADLAAGADLTTALSALRGATVHMDGWTQLDGMAVLFHLLQIEVSGWTQVLATLSTSSLFGGWIAGYTDAQAVGARYVFPAPSVQGWTDLAADGLAWRGALGAVTGALSLVVQPTNLRSRSAGILNSTQALATVNRAGAGAGAVQGALSIDAFIGLVGQFFAYVNGVTLLDVAANLIVGSAVGGITNRSDLSGWFARLISPSIAVDGESVIMALLYALRGASISASGATILDGLPVRRAPLWIVADGVTALDAVAGARRACSADHLGTSLLTAEAARWVGASTALSGSLLAIASAVNLRYPMAASVGLSDLFSIASAVRAAATQPDGISLIVLMTGVLRSAMVDTAGSLTVQWSASRKGAAAGTAEGATTISVSFGGWRPVESVIDLVCVAWAAIAVARDARVLLASQCSVLASGAGWRGVLADTDGAGQLVASVSTIRAALVAIASQTVLLAAGAGWRGASVTFDLQTSAWAMPGVLRSPWVSPSGYTDAVAILAYVQGFQVSMATQTILQVAVAICRAATVSLAAQTILQATTGARRGASLPIAMESAAVADLAVLWAAGAQVTGSTLPAAVAGRLRPALSDLAGLSALQAITNRGIAGSAGSSGAALASSTGGAKRGALVDESGSTLLLALCGTYRGLLVASTGQTALAILSGAKRGAFAALAAQTLLVGSGGALRGADAGAVGTTQVTWPGASNRGAFSQLDTATTIVVTLNAAHAVGSSVALQCLAQATAQLSGGAYVDLPGSGAVSATGGVLRGSFSATDGITTLLAVYTRRVGASGSVDGLPSVTDTSMYWIFGGLYLPRQPHGTMMYGTAAVVTVGGTVAALIVGRQLTNGILFSDSSNPSTLNDYATWLLRSTGDDYARLRVPDTDCPAIYDSTADSGGGDVGEPNRWSSLTQSPNTFSASNGNWVCTIASGSTSASFMGLAYTCFPHSDDFTMQFEIDAQSYTGSYNGAWATGLGLRLSSGSTSVWVGIGFGPSNLRVGMYVGATGNAGYTPGYTGSAPMTAEVRRVSNALSCRFAYRDNNNQPVWSSWISLGSISGDLGIELQARRINIAGGGYDQRAATCALGYIVTWVDANYSAYVETPVLYVASGIVQSIAVTGTSYNALKFRYGNTEAGCLASEWQTGSLPNQYYPYWQVRVEWTGSQTLIDRIELIVSS